ncbi:septum formation initiator family protein [uncultured Clostridium sp.]|uniref:FtsB family cell division protein n=1 Tax=uncultured Clostridium sp. TaxID=59620 RepID=UPI002624A8F0|nr:septum formation initiator family protein [uncultured Clostridium sp.]
MKMKLNVKRIALVGVSILCAGTLMNQEITKRRLNDEKKEIESKLENLTQENKDLTNEFDDSKTDEYIERLARERLGMIKKGETVVVD